MAPATVAAPAPKYTTTGTVSSPLDLESFASAKGEHETVRLTSAKGSQIRPKPKVTLTSLTVNNSGTLRKLNSVVIPIVYSDKFYKDVLDPSLDDINKIVYYADIPVGAICCRFDNQASTSKEKPPTLIILTLAVLAPYRSQSLGSALLLSALKASLHPAPPPPPLNDAKAGNKAPAPVTLKPRKPVNRAMAHVQVGNEDAKRFYERLGFKETEVVKDYYSKMQPRDAILMVCEDIRAALGEQANGDT
ncbi:hypothetical protein BD324DRAFT_649488 [Kockovaella imperatae]|uniref:N-acetyltransferase domain-containing protein n=1 Tax=Kockovaella imperatae TaxID=4999 RepID=A0A1Y1UMX9_9TREE|nr:hypothetical protein BD324DRAFT_649488 [Kockovaella imperatae]ORX39413.1 hypothetical protein BD324DRAFT_649488 [Kockovaella imperatae]